MKEREQRGSFTVGINDSTGSDTTVTDSKRDRRGIELTRLAVVGKPEQAHRRWNECGATTATESRLTWADVVRILSIPAPPFATNQT